MATRQPSMHQRLRRLMLLQLTQPARLRRHITFTTICAVVLFLLATGVYDSEGLALLSAALIVSGLVIVQFSELTRDAADVTPGCPLPEDRPVHTGRLVIRPAMPADAEAYAASIDDQFRRENGWTARTEAEWLAALHSKHCIASAMGYFVIERADGEVVGGLIAQPFPGTVLHHLGWWVRDDHRRQGYAREAVGAFTDELRQSGVRPLVFGMRTTSIANHRIAASLAATLVGTAPFTLPNGEQPQSDWFLLE